VPLTIEGNVNKEFANKIYTYVLSGGKSIIVNSFGGDAFYGQEIGLFLIDKGVSITVDRYCFSACANYLYLSGQSKYLRRGAILGFHGMVDPDVLSTQISKGGSSRDKTLELMIINERKFREKLGIDVGFLSKSFDLVKNENNFYEVEIFEKKVVRKIFRAEEKLKAAEFIADFLKTKPNGKWSIRLFNQAAIRSVYFPSEETLIGHGVTGISNYPYPKSQKELDNMAKKIGKDLKARGEFEIVEVQE
jgi:hypothetical protein